MEVTQVPAEMPDVNVRLSASEASLLTRFFADLVIHEIANSMGIDSSNATAHDVYALTAAIYTKLANLSY